ncbi:hypothetical protein CNY67_10335 [Desulfovibrio sp. G11]|nr:hypothetical protein CNY67_10335 [Desulfovibrio sp. G11]
MPEKKNRGSCATSPAISGRLPALTAKTAKAARPAHRGKAAWNLKGIPIARVYLMRGGRSSRAGVPPPLVRLDVSGLDERQGCNSISPPETVSSRNDFACHIKEKFDAEIS